MKKTFKLSNIMKLTKILAASAAAIAVLACGNSQVEGSKQVRSLLPTKGEVDTTSYLLGVNFGLIMTQNGFGDLNMAQIQKGMKDALNAKEGQPMDSAFVKQFKINPADMNMVINSFLQKRTAYEGALNKEKGDNFRKDFFVKNSADSTASGIVYLIQDSGSEVRGWTAGMKLVGAGGKITLVIPAELAYGERGPREIGANSTLVFDVDLLEVHPFVEKPVEEPAKPVKKK